MMSQKKVVNIPDVISQLDSYTTLKITNITQQYIMIEIGSLRSKQPKYYKINILGNDAKLKKVASFISRYPSRKAVMSHFSLTFFQKWFTKLNFQEINITQQFCSDQLKSIINLSPRKIVFSYNLHIQQVPNICSLLRKSTFQNQLILQFHLSQMKLKQVIDVLDKWILNLDRYGLEFQKIIFMTPDPQKIISFQSRRDFGTFLYFSNYQMNSDNTIKILEILKNSNNTFSVEICQWQQCFMEVIKFLVKSFSHQINYIVKFGNFVQATNQQFSINTIGINKQEVLDMFDILMLPGHYELIFHSSKEYFQNVIKLFMRKPILKLKYFVPYSEFIDIQQGIQILEKEADNLKQRLTKFLEMLDHPININIDLAIKLYLAFPHSIN